MRHEKKTEWPSSASQVAVLAAPPPPCMEIVEGVSLP